MTRCPVLASLCGVLAMLVTVAAQPVEAMSEAELSAMRYAS